MGLIAFQMTDWCLLIHLSPGQDGRHLAVNIFKRIFLNENDKIPIPFSLRLGPEIPIDKKSAFLQVMVSRRTGDKQFLGSVLSLSTGSYMRR